MATPIHLKHSAQAGRVPDAGVLANGELAINTKDVKAYIKNADGQVVQIAGGGSGADDDRYVKLAGDGTAQEITGTGGLKTEGLLESTGGLNTYIGNVTFYRATGGMGLAQGFEFDVTSNILSSFSADGNKKDLTIRTDKNLFFEYDETAVFRGNEALFDNEALGINSVGQSSVFTVQPSSLNAPDKNIGILTQWTGNTGMYSQLCHRYGPLSGMTAFFKTDILSTATTTFATNSLLIGYEANHTLKQSGITCEDDTEVYGFRSSVTPADNGVGFNFYARNSTPNFFGGDTYIGGNTTRNTLELWKSTLTEEQLEQLEAGNVAVPANVSTPGDGSFARAWYYDQQDEETQLALDSGELEYPTHLAAATFTDTFDLGQNTLINLENDGLGVFKKGIKTYNNDILFYRNSSESQGFKFEIGGTNAIESFSGAGLEKDFYIRNTTEGRRIVVEADGGSVDFQALGILTKWYGYVGTYSQLIGSDTYSDDVTFFKTDIISTATSTFESTASLRGYEALFDLTQAGLTIDPETKGYGFYSDVKGNAGKTYNFYAAGSAPNYFKGDCVVSADSDDASDVVNGTARGMSVGTGGLLGATRSSDDQGAVLTLNRGGTGAERRFIQFTDVSGGGGTGFIYTDGSGIKMSNVTTFALMDERLLTSTNDITNAISGVKLLEPKQEGFIAHTLQSVVPQAVTGSQGATEAIGTLTDYDGTVLETEVTEPSADELTYTEDVTDDEGVTTQEVRTKTWSATGTRDVYQGVDQTKLIPLLTKALQEALERIEVLESAAGGASVAKATTKKK